MHCCPVCCPSRGEVAPSDAAVKSAQDLAVMKRIYEACTSGAGANDGITLGSLQDFLSSSFGSFDVSDYHRSISGPLKPLPALCAMNEAQKEGMKVGKQPITRYRCRCETLERRWNVIQDSDNSKRMFNVAAQGQQKISKEVALHMIVYT